MSALRAPQGQSTFCQLGLRAQSVTRAVIVFLINAVPKGRTDRYDRFAHARITGCQHRVSWAIVCGLILPLLRRSELFRTLIRQPVEFFDTAEVGVLTSRIGADCQAVVRCLSTNLNVALRNGLQCLGMPHAP